ncbi:MAG: tetratricopeptide repeat protein [Candidatus Omnitrophota bacterium]|nr:MAG: tetratricopeptide repeat protein [Candidatus Omnitrophota bacterium]
MKRKTFSKIFILVLIFAASLFFQSLICFCENTNSGIENFYRANFLYEQTQYTEAIKQYEALIEKGLVSANLYYNLGNSYFKKGDLGKAILYYERAKRLAPRDIDLESNYAYARSLIKAKITEQRPLWFVHITGKLFAKLTMDELTLFIFFLYIAIVSSIILGLYLKFMKPYTRFLLIIFGIMLILGVFALGARICCHYADAIIVKEAEAKFEPFERGTTHFVLSEGMKVSIRSSKDGWAKVKRIDGKIGWVNQSFLERI